MLSLTIQNTLNDEVFQIEVEESGSVEDIKVLICAEKNIDVESQILLHNGKLLQFDDQKISVAGVKNYDMILVSTRQAIAGAQQLQQQPQRMVQPPPQQQVSSNDASLLNSFFTDLGKQNIQITPQQMQQRRGLGGKNLFNQVFNDQMHFRVQEESKRLKDYYLNNPTQLHYILNQDPELGNAIAAEDDALIQQIVNKRMKEQMERKRKEMERMNRLQSADPNDIETQKEIEEEIRKSMVEENYQWAQEEFPEFFGQITMLYITAKVNGHEIQAFVDSGAQSTIISASLAEKVGLMRLVDTRFAGMAMGVGTSKILGRIHAGEMEILGKKFICSFTVLEDNKVEFLFGLDNLKRHQCNIDLVNNQLHMRNGEVSVPFLSEGEIKKNEFEEEKQALLERQKSQGAKVNETEVKELCEMGFTRAQVLEALSICDGIKEHAANYLMQQAQHKGNSPTR